MEWIEFAFVLILAAVVWAIGMIPEDNSFEEDEEWTG